MTTDIPRVGCRAWSEKVWTFDCDHCGVPHLHGAGAGHRAAHCTSPSSPYQQTGYILYLTNEELIGHDQTRDPQP